MSTAVDELSALVTAMRGWDDDEIRRVITTRQVTGWPFPHIALVLLRVAVTDGAQLADLGRKRRRKRKPMSLAAVQPATAQLVALAVKVRDTWDEAELRTALAACHGAGWPFAQAALEVAHLMAIPASEPRDLEAAARSPYSRRTLGDRRG